MPFLEIFSGFEEIGFAILRGFLLEYRVMFVIIRQVLAAYSDQATVLAEC